MLILEFIARILDILRSAATPRQIALGCIIGMIGGLAPSIAITIFVYLTLIVFNVNLTAGLFSVALFRILAWIIDPVLNAIGYLFLVQIAELRPLWNLLYSIPFFPYTSFNNTVVMGALIVSTLLAIPLYIFLTRAIIIYRTRYSAKVQNWRITKYIRSTLFYRWFKYLQHIGERLW